MPGSEPSIQTAREKTKSGRQIFSTVLDIEATRMDDDIVGRVDCICEVEDVLVRGAARESPLDTPHPREIVL